MRNIWFLKYDVLIEFDDWDKLEKENLTMNRIMCSVYYIEE